MHLRRALLLFALVLGLSALAASIAPAPREDDDNEPAAVPAPTPRGAAVDELRLRFRAPLARGRKPPARKLPADRPAEVRVASDADGQASIPSLGRTATVTATVPARFELLSPPTGRHDVFVTATGEEPVKVGTVVAERR